jgi:hypothetical protein
VASLYTDARDILLTQGEFACPGGCCASLARPCFKCHMAHVATSAEPNNNEASTDGNNEALMPP